MRPIITLLTDFGSSDPFVGIMKGVILGIAPEARIVDLCHGIPPYDLIQAGFFLKMSYPYFPEGSIHVAVVDPGVGGPRRPILVFCDDRYFIGPDNGLFSFLYTAGKVRQVIEITASGYFLPKVSSTFHGRDLFAPVAARLAKGVEFWSFGQPITDYRRLEIPTPRLQGHLLRGEVLHVDRFGNLITNIPEETLTALVGEGGGEVRVEIGGREIMGLSAFYAEVGKEKLGALIGSSGHLEIFINQGSASDLLQARRGQEVLVCRL
ncbi:MAG: SAM-dependent chlorinase/fluorinase [candidate division NC10 bacterium]|nr:SAM-dependent chlorinase/fluorinase [candidate division NC10 bacterium]